MNFSRFFRPAHIPALLIMLLLFCLSSRPGDGMPPLPSPQDKFVHFGAYFVLGLSLCLWVRGERWTMRPWKHALLVLAACALFGISDEFHQSFVPGRSVSGLDLLADMLGSIAAVVLYKTARIYRIADRICFSRRLLGLTPSVLNRR